MRQHLPNVLLFLLLAGAGTAGLWYYERTQAAKRQAAAEAKAQEEKDKPPPPEPKKDTPDAKAPDAKTPEPKAPDAKANEPKKEPPPAAKPREPETPPTLIAIGDDTFFNKALLSTRGAGVQLLVLPKFDASDRLGREARPRDDHGRPTGPPYPLYLIPGIRKPAPLKMDIPYPAPDLQPGPVPPVYRVGDNLVPWEEHLAEPAYTIFHYPTPEDVKNPYPDPHLGTVNWKVVSEERPQGGTHRVVFETELPELGLRLRKTFTLAPTDYHLGMALDIEATDARQKGKVFRYQVSGPRGLPIEGEWYTATPRVGLIGWNNDKGAAQRRYEDAATVVIQHGGDRVERAGNTFKYAAIATPFFASALAVDDTAEGPAANPWDYVRITSEVPIEDTPNRDRAAYDDISFRAVSEKLDPGPKDRVSHRYLVYNGPVKVRLLKMLEGDRAVDPALVDRYHDRLGLRTMTDYRSESALGRFANAIYWTDLVIACTNLMHSLLYQIHEIVPSWGWSIFVLTIFVRLLLFFPSKKQTQMNMRMMEVQKKLKPELDKLHEKYKDDFHAYNREKTRLMMANGMNPFAAMGGCLLLFLQMPIMMGLYFGLQESIFFRLEPFLWIRNLSAPDMTLWWGEGIPYISTPGSIGGFLYLGPYLNVLPLIAVGLMLWQQTKMMPPPTDEQMAAQQRMMKIMMIVVAFMFYKVAAGLALYFIIGSVWGLVERRLIPKAEDKPGDDTGATAGLPPKGGSPNGTAAPRGFLGRLKERVREKMEELQRQAEEQASRQLKNKPGDPRQPDRRDRDRKKKRRG